AARRPRLSAGSPLPAWAATPRAFPSRSSRRRRAPSRAARPQATRPRRARPRARAVDRRAGRHRRRRHRRSHERRTGGGGGARGRGGAEVHGIGGRDGVEARRVPEAGLPFHPISTGKLRRYWDRKNVSDLFLRVPAGFVQSVRLLRRLRPAVLFSAGGFVSVPPALAARALGIPIVVHEQTAVPGLANRITARFAARIAVSFQSGGSGFAAGRVVLPGHALRAAV